VTVLVPNITTAVDMGLIGGLNTGDEGYTSDVRSFMQAGVNQSFTLADIGVTVSNGWTLAVTGLPSGWKYDAKTGTFSGAATKVGKTFVSFTVSKKSGRTTISYKATATFDLAPLPGWASGTFIGATVNSTVSGATATRIPAEDGIATVTVTAGGSISAACAFSGTKLAFKGTGFALREDGAYEATLSGKIGKKAVSLKFTVSKREDVDTGVAGVELGCASLTGMLAANKRIDSSVNGGGACLYQNLWLRADAGALDLPMGLAGVDCSMIFNVKNRLSMRFGANGSVICTAVMSNGTSTASTSVILVRKESVDKWIGNVVVSIPSRTVKSGKKTVTVAGLHIIVPIEVTSPTIPAGAPGILVGGEGAVYYDFGDGEYLVEQP
jgi:hypothetical protein